MTKPELSAFHPEPPCMRWLCVLGSTRGTGSTPWNAWLSMAWQLPDELPYYQRWKHRLLREQKTKGSP